MTNGSIILVEKNENWDKCTDISITVMTPVFNRRHTIERAIKSVEMQSFRNIEYIIIDDGSTETSDDIIFRYLKNSSLPVMYIKKSNGGVHTARNIGYEYARGKLIINVDSDDEMLPDGCKTFWDTWESIPEHEKKHCWQIKAHCRNQKGDVTGTPFPDNINDLPIDSAWVHFSLSHGDQSGCRVTSIMKENPFPEPDKVTFVSENLHWIPLERKYRSWGINRVTDIVHTEGSDHLSNIRTKTTQTCRNAMWNAMVEANNVNMYLLKGKYYIRKICIYSVMEKILFFRDREFVKKNRLTGIGNKIMYTLLFIPSIVGACVYIKVRMK